MRQNLVPRLFNMGGPVNNGQDIPKMNPMDVVQALKSGEIQEADLPKVGYRDAMELKQSLEAMAQGRQQQQDPRMQQQQDPRMQQQQDPRMQQMQQRRDPSAEEQAQQERMDEEQAAQEQDLQADNTRSNSKIKQAANSFSSGDIKEGIRHVVGSDLSVVKDDIVDGMSSLAPEAKNRLINRLSKRKDEASVAVSGLISGEDQDIESVIAALENSKYDITDNKKVRMTRHPMSIQGMDDQVVESIFQGPGFTLQVTGDFLSGVVDGQEFVKPRD